MGYDAGLEDETAAPDRDIRERCRCLESGLSCERAHGKTGRHSRGHRLGVERKHVRVVLWPSWESRCLLLPRLFGSPGRDPGEAYI